MIFNEKCFYKDRSSVEIDIADSDISPQKSEFIRLEWLPDVRIKIKNLYKKIQAHLYPLLLHKKIQVFKDCKTPHNNSYFF
jgi:hypothetical protein